MKFEYGGSEHFVEFCEEVEFLGRIFTAGGGGDLAVERRIQKAWRLFWCYEEVLCDRTVSFRARVRYLVQTVGSCLL